MFTARNISLDFKDNIFDFNQIFLYFNLMYLRKKTLRLAEKYVQDLKCK